MVNKKIISKYQLCSQVLGNRHLNVWEGMTPFYQQGEIG